MVYEEVVRTAKIPCDRPLIRILALLLNRGHHLTTDLGRGWFRRKTHTLARGAPRSIWKRAMKIDENIRPIRVTSAAREMNQSKLPMRSPAPACRIIRPLPKGFQTQSPRWPWPAHFESLREGDCLPSGTSAGNKDVVKPYFGQYSPVCLSRWGPPSPPALREWPIDAQDLCPWSQPQTTQSEEFNGTRRRLREQACILDFGCAQSL